MKHIGTALWMDLALVPRPFHDIVFLDLFGCINTGLGTGLYHWNSTIPTENQHQYGFGTQKLIGSLHTDHTTLYQSILISTNILYQYLPVIPIGSFCFMIMVSVYVPIILALYYSNRKPLQDLVVAFKTFYAGIKITDNFKDFDSKICILSSFG